MSHYTTTIVSNGAAGRCVDVSGSGAGADATLRQSSCSSGDARLFKLVLDQADCLFRVQPRSAPGSCVAARGPGAEATVLPCDPSADAQKWRFVKASDGNYRIETTDDRCFDSGDGTDGTIIRTQPCTDRPQQLFALPGMSDSIINPAPTSQALISNFIDVHDPRSIEIQKAVAIGMTWSTAVRPSWSFPKPGGYLEYTVRTGTGNPSNGFGSYEGPHLLVMSASAWLNGAGVNVLVDGEAVGRVSFPARQDRDVFGETVPMAFDLAKGTHKLRFVNDDVPVPFRIESAYITATKVHLPMLGTVTPVLPSDTTRIDITAISSDYRFELDDTSGPLSWRVRGYDPEGTARHAFLEYAIDVAKPGRYKTVVSYWSKLDLNGLDILVNGRQAAGVNLPTAGPSFVDTAAQTIDLPAGASKLRFVARFLPHDVMEALHMANGEFKIGAVTLSPAQ